MQAKIDNNTLVLIPENKVEETQVRDFAATLERPYMIQHKGFKYMDKEVEFYFYSTDRD